VSKRTFPAHIKPATTCALVNRALVEEVLDSVADVLRARRQGAPPDRKGGRSRVASPALLGMRIDTLLRWAARDRLPNHRAQVLGKILGVKRQMLSPALRWLALHGVARQKTPPGSWSIAMPPSRSQIGLKFIPVPEAGLYLRSGHDFLVLTLLHYLAELGIEPGTGKRRGVIPLARWVDPTPLVELGLGRKLMRSSLRRLEAAGFISTADGDVQLTPKVAADRMAKRRGGENVWTLMRTPKKVTIATFARLRGEQVPAPLSPQCESSSSRGEAGPPLPAPVLVQEVPRSVSGSSFKPLCSGSGEEEIALSEPEDARTA